MSKSNASAKNRRAYGGNPPPAASPASAPAPASSSSLSQNVANMQQSPQQGFTIQQVIKIIDNRLLKVENFMKQTASSDSKKVTFSQDLQQPTNDSPSSSNISTSLEEILMDFNNRFEMIAEEIVTLKDVVLKLQTYTMDVNKTLLEERIHIFSDLGNSAPSTFQDMENNMYDISISPTRDITNDAAITQIVIEDQQTNINLDSN